MQCRGQDNDGAAGLDARPGGQRGRPRQSNPRPPAPRGPPAEPPARGSTPITPPAPARLTHQRPARPRPAPGAAEQLRPSTRQGGMRGAMLPAMRGVQGQGLQSSLPVTAKGAGRGTEGWWRGTTARPPPSPPNYPPCGPRDAGDGPWGRQPSTPPKARGAPPPPPPPPKRAAAPGGERR